LQWQVAIKPAEELKENEEEWANIPGAHGLTYTFVVADGMEIWRWRLRVDLAEGEAIYSEEMTLPDIADEPAEEVEEETEATLPVANITFTANAPADEITEGTEITLSAEIENPREGMLLQWQHMPAEAELTEGAWVSVEGAVESSYAYMLGEENEGWLWRLLITVPEPEAVAEATDFDEESDEARIVGVGSEISE
jgi:hypothetical protein